MAFQTPLSEKLFNKRLELDAAKRHVEILTAEVRVWEEAEALLRKVMPDTTQREDAKAIRQVRSDAFHFEPAASGQRAMKGAWRAVMQNVASIYPDQFTLDQLEEAADVAGHPVNRNTARSQMSNYASVGFVERVQQGVFRLTPKGKTASGALSNAPSHSETDTKSPTADDVQAVRGSSAQNITAPEASED